jgi:hypothetical protein
MAYGETGPPAMLGRVFAVLSVGKVLRGFGRCGTTLDLATVAAAAGAGIAAAMKPARAAANTHAGQDARHLPTIRRCTTAGAACRLLRDIQTLR